MLKHVVLLLASLFMVSACSASDKAAAPAAPATAAAEPAVPTRQWELGADYMLIDPRVPTSTGAKIEVVEVFSYACPHCAHFQPSVDELKAKLPANAQLVLVPAVFRPEWQPFARAFYTAQALGILDKTHQALFDALYEQHLPLTTLDTLVNGFYASHGANPATFMSTANSFVIDSKLAHGDQLVRDYGVTGTPSLIVNGKYRVEMSSERKIGPAEAIQIVLYLVQQEAAAAKKSLTAQIRGEKPRNRG
jgi:protein dithiol oxidoreductase (disulfide-forming)